MCVSDNYRHFDSLMWHDLGVGLQQKRSRVRFPAVPLSGNNLGQVVHTPVPLSPSSIIWYRSMGGDPWKGNHRSGVALARRHRI